MRSHEAQAIERRIDSARARVRTLLENTRNPQAPADVPHQYEDKYHLAEHLTRVSIASLVQCLEVVGLTREGLLQLCEWAKTRSVTLRLHAEEDCRLLREASRKDESGPELVTETRGFLGTKTTTSKVVTTVKEWFWAFDVKYEVVAFQGNAPERAVTLLRRAGSIEIKTLTKDPPRAVQVTRSPVDVSVTWLLEHLDGNGGANFSIDRAAEDCRTPRRNEPIEEALREMAQIAGFCESVTAYFFNDVFPAHEKHDLDLAAIHPRGVFVPVLPLFEDAEGKPRRGVLPADYADTFLAEEQRSLAEKCRALSASFPRDGTLITAVEAGLLVTVAHVLEVCQTYAGGVAYIEEMLRRQLVAAIGKELTAADFTAFMQFHHAKLVKPEFGPTPFSYAIRRPDHYPEGALSLETEAFGSMPEPISTTVAHREQGSPMSFALDASTRVTFTGERFLHGWIAHQFSGEKALALQLVARARQFSSFILLVGRIASADRFEPRFGVIVQNKDLLKIPIMLEQIPTPTEFRDAIESLSPEQQRFAKSFRGMQLESTLFGVCVIQIKPQLEKLLKLPGDSLTKEIKLTQELLSLFIEYQIPSDLLSYDGAADAPTDAKLALVKDYVARMRDMIELSKKREIDEEREREALRLAEMNMTTYPEAPPAFGGAPPPAFDAQARSLGVGSTVVAAAPQGFGPPPPSMAKGGSAPVSRSVAAGGAPRPAAVTAAAPPAPPAATPPATAAAEPARPRPRVEGAATNATDREPGDAIDYTRIPGELDRRLEAIDEDSALRATILTPRAPWSGTAQKGLLSAAKDVALDRDDLTQAKNRAFDLLDALTRSGALAIDDASLHVVIAATHAFDKTLVDTVIQDNVNPIEKVERSLMILGTTIHGKPASDILADEHRERFLAGSPLLGPATDPEGD